MIWMNSETRREPNDWIRKIMDCHYVPILSDMDLTPESLIGINHYNCKALIAAALSNMNYRVTKLVVCVVATDHVPIAKRQLSTLVKNNQQIRTASFL